MVVNSQEGSSKRPARIVRCMVVNRHRDRHDYPLELPLRSEGGMLFDANGRWALAPVDGRIEISAE